MALSFSFPLGRALGLLFSLRCVSCKPPVVGCRGSRCEGERAIAEDGIDWRVHRSDGVRHASADVMAALARGDASPREAYYFRTVMRFQTGAPAWLHLNKLLALAVGEGQADRVVLDVYRVS